MDALKKSLQEDPEFLNIREVVVYPYNDRYVALGGNMRVKALQELGSKSVFCKVISKNAPIDKLKAFTIKDNGDYGKWDWDLLANEWDEDLLKDWGVDLWSENVSQDDFGENFTLPDGEKSKFEQISFTLSGEQAEEIRKAIKKAQGKPEFSRLETYGNENKNGNGLYYIVKQWADVKILL